MSILVLVTNPDDADDAVAWAARYAATNAHDVQLVLAGDDTPGAPQYVSPKAQARLTEAVAAAGVAHTVHEERRDPVDRTMQLADEVDAELIVISNRRRSATMKLIMGSTAQQVLLRAECPVVVIKPARNGG